MEVRKRGIQGREGEKREKGDGLYTNMRGRKLWIEKEVCPNARKTQK